jgi:hypothetical protein
MVLNLHYVLTAHSEITGDTGPLREQLIMGLALKTLHDYPVLNDQTAIMGNPVFPNSLTQADNRFRLNLQPIPANEAVNYWTAGSQPLRLSAYYQVSVALLEPEQIQARAGRVLTYGVYPFIAGMPRLESSRNTVTFTVPGELNPHVMDLQPAAATYNQIVSFLGTALTATQTSLLLLSAKWDQAIEIDPAWNIQAKSGEVSATLQKQIVQPLPLPAKTILPGIYSAQVKVGDTRQLSDGSVKTFERFSNFTPFTIAPQVDPLGAPNAITLVLNITGGIFQDPELKPENVEVYIAETRLAAGTYNALNNSEFGVNNATTLQIRLPLGLVSGAWLPFRLIINGAESQPQWIQVP